MSKPLKTSRATIEDVAKLAGVSTATVSRVLNKKGQVAAGTIQRVQEAISQLNYVAHVSARDLASSKTNTIGLILPDTGKPFFTRLLRGINDSTNNHNLHLLIYATPDIASTQSGNPLPVGEHNTDGIIIFTGSVDEPSIIQFYRRHFPIVLLHRPPPAGTEIPAVMFENRSGARAVVNHLIHHGRRRIAYLRGPDGNQDSVEREQGYHDALAKHNLPFDPSLIGHGGFTDKIAEEQVSQWLADRLEFDAIFAGDDNAAMGVMTVLRAAGIKIPDDVAVVGFNDDALARHLTPQLTTVYAPSAKAGFAAAEQLVKLINGQPAEPVTHLPTELVIRESCGAGRRL